jgi:hypothetical protein
VEAARPARDWQANEATRLLADLQESGQTDSVAVALLAVFGPRWGWGAEWVTRLDELRQHSDLDVRLAARELWLA